MRKVRSHTVRTQTIQSSRPDLWAPRGGQTHTRTVYTPADASDHVGTFCAGPTFPSHGLPSWRCWCAVRGQGQSHTWVLFREALYMRWWQDGCHELFQQQGRQTPPTHTQKTTPRQPVFPKTLMPGSRAPSRGSRWKEECSQVPNSTWTSITWK